MGVIFAPPCECKSFEGAPKEINSGLAFLASASAKHLLVEAGALALDDAIAELASAYGGILCTCNRKMLERWERVYPPRGRR